MSIYGEGAYRCPDENELHYPPLRGEGQMKEGQWEHLCPECGTERERPAGFEDGPPVLLLTASSQFEHYRSLTNTNRSVQ